MTMLQVSQQMRLPLVCVPALTVKSVCGTLHSQASRGRAATR